MQGAPAERAVLAVAFRPPVSTSSRDQALQRGVTVGVVGVSTHVAGRIWARFLEHSIPLSVQ